MPALLLLLVVQRKPAVFKITMPDDIELVFSMQDPLVVVEGRSVGVRFPLALIEGQPSIFAIVARNADQQGVLFVRVEGITLDGR